MYIVDTELYNTYLGLENSKALATTWKSTPAASLKIDK